MPWPRASAYRTAPSGCSGAWPSWGRAARKRTSAGSFSSASRQSTPPSRSWSAADTPPQRGPGGLPLPHRPGPGFGPGKGTPHYGGGACRCLGADGGGVEDGDPPVPEMVVSLPEGDGFHPPKMRTCFPNRRMLGVSRKSPLSGTQIAPAISADCGEPWRGEKTVQAAARAVHICSINLQPLI